MSFAKFKNIQISWISSLLLIQTLSAYTPVSISGKYTTSTIDSGDFCYSYWMDTTMTSNYGSNAKVRESFAPSAVVDHNGNLYAITLWGFSDSTGPKFAIHKYVNGSLSKRITNFSPWEKIPNVTPACKNTPEFKEEADKQYFKNYIHNAFMPCLAQELDSGNSEYLYGFSYIPPTQLMGSSLDKEGVLFFKIKKDLSGNISTCFNDFKISSESKLREYNLSYPQPQFGNFKACYNSENQTIFLYDWNACYAFNTSGSRTGTQAITYNGNIGCGFPTMRFQKLDNYFYHMTMADGYLPRIFMQSTQNPTPEIFTKVGCNNTFMYIEGLTRGNSFFLYPFDFLVLDGKSNNILCILGFQGSINSKSAVYNNSEKGWSPQYCNFSYKNLSLLVWSYPITKDNTVSSSFYTYSYPEYIQNVIYTTSVQLSHSYLTTTSTIAKKIYLNTQKMCTYKNYIIYAYCYPGKSGKGNHLYIGYVSYALYPNDSTSPDKNIRLKLLTKTEFKNDEDDSFITDCSRIISLDCKNGHIWLTYMNSDNTQYKYFYIKASDLVGE